MRGPAMLQYALQVRVKTKVRIVSNNTLNNS